MPVNVILVTIPDLTSTHHLYYYRFGIVLYEVFSRREPYEGESFEEVIKGVKDPAVNKRPPIPLNCPPLIEGLITDCLVADPTERPSFEEIHMRLKRMDISKVETGGRRTEVSLFDIFPKHIAEALRDGREVEAEHKDIVTIFFSGRNLQTGADTI